MPLDTKRIRALCFDVDGTLSDTDDYYVRKIARSLRPVRWLFRDGDHERAARRLVMWVESPGNALVGLADRLGIDDEVAALVDWIYRHRRKPWKQFLIVPGVKEMLARLHGHYPMAVVSARDLRGTLAFLDQFELTPFFDVIVTALTTRRTKPFPDPVLHAAEKMAVPPQACLMIGDTTVDIRAGRAAGAQTIGVLCGFGEETELRQLGADLIPQNTAEVAGVLLQDGRKETPPHRERRNVRK